MFLVIHIHGTKSQGEIRADATQVLAAFVTIHFLRESSRVEARTWHWGLMFGIVGGHLAVNHLHS